MLGCSNELPGCDNGVTVCSRLCLLCEMLAKVMRMKCHDANYILSGSVKYLRHVKMLHYLFSLLQPQSIFIIGKILLYQKKTLRKIVNKTHLGTQLSPVHI